jgi:hypothetical protein
MRIRTRTNENGGSGPDVRVHSAGANLTALRPSPKFPSTFPAKTESPPKVRFPHSIATMGKRKVGALEKVDADLANLQYKVRRDPASYRDDFQNQYNQYETFRELFLQNPSTTDEGGIVSLRELIDFISHVANCYPELTAKFPDDLIQIITLHHEVLESELRDKIVGSLVLLRNKDVIDSSKYEELVSLAKDLQTDRIADS